MLDIETEKKKAFDLWMPVAVNIKRSLCAESRRCRCLNFDNDLMEQRQL
jgi:hypothetical protein